MDSNDDAQPSIEGQAASAAETLATIAAEASMKEDQTAAAISDMKPEQLATATATAVTQQKEKEQQQQQQQQQPSSATDLQQKKKRKPGRPPGSTDSRPRKKRAPLIKPPPPPPLAPESNKAVREAEAAVEDAEVAIKRAQQSVKRAQAKLEKAQEEAQKVQNDYDKSIEQQANAKLALVPTVLPDNASEEEQQKEDKNNNTGNSQPSPNKKKKNTTKKASKKEINFECPETLWILYFHSLAAFIKKEGHMHLKKNDNSRDSLLPILRDNKSLRGVMSLSRWVRIQRQAKKANTLEPYKVVLLNRIEFVWEAKAGEQDGHRWMSKYEMLKAYKEQFGGDCDNMTYENAVQLPAFKDKVQEEDKKKLFKALQGWVKVQRTHYRNNGLGKEPGLSSERVQLLNALNFKWGEPRVLIPWEVRFAELKRYHAQHGHSHVPWQWVPNRPLSRWVNEQRNKYRDLHNGKPSSLTAEQIQKLEAIGFQWSTQGKGRYDRSIEQKQQEQQQSQHNSTEGAAQPQLQQQQDSVGSPEQCAGASHDLGHCYHHHPSTYPL